jgi:hypothetical protein
MYFVLIALLELLLLRRLGWLLSKRFLYPGPDWGVGFVTAIWGSLIAGFEALSIWYLHPMFWIEAILGWALGAYLAIPNYGLFRLESIPNYALDRHRFISTRPLISYLIVAALCAVMVHHIPVTH